ncbi:hypothetical protein KKA50_03300 [Patescibacteria group bacterium]|nr:hypothetical protein [Patescibacteria group bacterium]
MKNKWIIPVVVLVVVVVILAVPWKHSPVLASMYNAMYENQYQDNVTYEAETKPGLIGSYGLWRDNGTSRWTEKDDWVSLGDLLNDTYKYRCVRFFYFQSGTFKAAEGYEWRLGKSPYGDPCLKLYPSWWPK